MLDTHTLLWAALNEEKLSAKAHRLLEDFDSEVFVSAASAWEIATKVRIGKLPGAEAFIMEFEERLDQLGFRHLPLTLSHAHRAGLLPGTHSDPFDRMLIAQAQAENMFLVSNEKLFDEYHVRRIW